MRFHDRIDAGRQLVQALADYRGQDVVVYALPRGGVVLGAEVARALQAPLDVIIARKIGHPSNPEYAVCAIAEAGSPVCNEVERAHLDPHWFDDAVAQQRREIERRRAWYRQGQASTSATGKIAIVVDDGIATGLTMSAAVQAVREQHPRQIVVAVPVAPAETAARLRQEGATVVALEIPMFFLGAVGAYYDDFAQVSDEEVVRLLQQAHIDPVYLFHLPVHDSLASHLAQELPFAPGDMTVGRYPNRELFVSLAQPVRGDRCVVLGSCTPPDEWLLETLLLCHTLKAEGATEITALVPYLAYARQEQHESLHSCATAWLGGALRAAGVARVVTVDIHSAEAMVALGVPVTSLSPAELFAAELARDELLDGATLVAPDEGALPRCERVRAATGKTLPIARVRKERMSDGVRAELLDPVGRRAIIIDDILDTGNTLVACCELLRATRTTEIIVMVTHGLFTGDRWRRLRDLAVTRIYCTDTEPLPANLAQEDVHVLPIAPLITPYLGDTIFCGGNT